MAGALYLAPAFFTRGVVYGQFDGRLWGQHAVQQQQHGYPQFIGQPQKRPAEKDIKPGKMLILGTPA